MKDICVDGLLFDMCQMSFYAMSAVGKLEPGVRFPRNYK